MDPTATSPEPLSTPGAPLIIDFGSSGNSEEFLVHGWSDGEPQWRWMTGNDSAIHIGHRCGRVEHVLELNLRPMTSRQRLTVTVNGVVIDRLVVGEPCRLGLRIPAGIIGGRDGVRIRFTHPDAVRPAEIGAAADNRQLSLAISRLRLWRLRQGPAAAMTRGAGGLTLDALERRVGMSPAKFISRFESFGNNCEFGLVQRACGAELFFSLLRFAGAELPTLLHAFDLRWTNFADPANVEIRVDDKPRPEFVAHENRFGLFFHTFRYQDEATAAQLHASESKRLAYCAERLVGDLRRGNKIFVVKRNEPLTEPQILPLYAALSAFGRNTLLWMVPADAAHPSGTVEAIRPGLFRGYIERFAPHENAPDFLLEHWLEVCANAHAFWLEDRQWVESRNAAAAAGANPESAPRPALAAAPRPGSDQSQRHQTRQA